ncbi:MAG: efflux RND transporter periplasmic adaptor subunit [Alphaproteobacteria bacterium]
MKKLIITTALAVWFISPSMSVSVYAQDHDDHGHEEQHETHDNAKGHAPDDGGEHNDHGEEKDDHDGHGHDSHTKKDSHDDHGHGSTGDGHDDHEEGKTEIDHDAAKRAGVVVEAVSAATINNTSSLTGRIVINQNNKAYVRARFPGIVRGVTANLGEIVKKGQALAIVESNESLRNYTVKSPIDGVILERNTNIGDVANGEALFMIADLTQVWAKFHVFPKDADSIKVSQDVRVHTLDERKVGNAPIGMLFPTADALSQTMVAIVPLSNENGLWRPGMTVEGDVSVSKQSTPVAVRVSAIQTMEDKSVVFVRNGKSYEMVNVKTGISDSNYIEIKDGLDVGQEYVSDGSFIIKADILKAGAEHQH